jgi:hypothetical protein
MHYLTTGESVGTGGRADQCAANSADCTVRLPESSLDGNNSATQEPAPRSMLPESADHGGASREGGGHAGRIASVNQVLHSTVAHIRRSALAIADLQESISRTSQKIRTSQMLIWASDLAIARAKSLDCK